MKGITPDGFIILKVKVRPEAVQEIKESLKEYFEDFFPTDEVEVLEEDQEEDTAKE